MNPSSTTRHKPHISRTKVANSYADVLEQARRSEAPPSIAQAPEPPDATAEAPAVVAASAGPMPAGGEVPDLAEISPEEGMRYYAAIIGREPTLDPEAPDLLPGMSEEGGASPAHTWARDFRHLRGEISRKLHDTLRRRPSFRDIMDSVSLAAVRRLDEARRRLQRRDAA